MNQCTLFSTEPMDCPLCGVAVTPGTVHGCARVPEQGTRTPPVYTDISEIEARAVRALARVRFPPATGSKRFARDMQGVTQMSERQRWFLWRVVYRFRRQIPNAIVDHAVRMGGNQK